MENIDMDKFIDFWVKVFHRTYIIGVVVIIGIAVMLLFRN